MARARKVGDPAWRGRVIKLTKDSLEVILSPCVLLDIKIM